MRGEAIARQALRKGRQEARFKLANFARRERDILISLSRAPLFCSSSALYLSSVVTFSLLNSNSLRKMKFGLHRNKIEITAIEDLSFFFFCLAL